MTLPRGFYDRPVHDVARAVLGCVVRVGEVAVRVTEVEAYAGARDPASHAYRGPTARNATMFAGPGLLYVYFSYGMHWCMNLVCGPAGDPSAVLLRAGEVICGLELARARRPAARRDRDLARGPARLTQALGVDRRFDGVDVTDPAAALTVCRGRSVAAAGIRSGPRVGVSTAREHPWRYWIDGDPTVSDYRPAAPRRRRTTS